jgi:pyridoxamine 5'-phosphate oxidase
MSSLAASLDEADLDPDPLAQFRRWFDQAVTASVQMPEAMTLATATADGMPAARVVLLRGVDQRGFVFFTNYQSRKGRELAANPRAALVFYWPELQRQVRIEGMVDKVAAGESDAYFQSRPHGHQLGAWASAQSETIAGREIFDERLRELQRQFPLGEVPRPEYWGGYRVVPQLYEFWQGRENRLHDRLCYRRQETGGWSIERLAP